MEWTTLTPLLLTAGAPSLIIIARAFYLRHRSQYIEDDDGRFAFVLGKAEPPDSKSTAGSGIRVLLCYAVVVCVFGIGAAIRYRLAILQHSDMAFFCAGLLLAMVAGMFVQVLSANYRAGHDLFNVSLSQIIFPLLFSPIVYYPIWAVAGSGTNLVFSIYAAFLNGYFWESIVSSAQPVTSSQTVQLTQAPSGAGPAGEVREEGQEK